MKTNPLTPDLLRKMDAYWRVASVFARVVGNGEAEPGPVATARQSIHLVVDVIVRDPRTKEAGVYLKQRRNAKWIEHKRYINTNGQDMPEIRHWVWGAPAVPRQ